METLKKQQIEEFVKLPEIENLKNEVYLSQSKVASITNRVETSDADQKLAAEALEKASKENAALKYYKGELSFKSIWLD